jgi:class 3 adenylate cyclase
LPHAGKGGFLIARARDCCDLAVASSLRSTCARRPLAVLFCDLVGSTELSERSGPEEYAYILKEYRALAIRAIEPFEAHVPEYLVDGIPVFFGFPIAHEDDTRRAILAARAIQDAIKRRNARLYVVQRPSRAQSWGEDVGRAG